MGSHSVGCYFISHQDIEKHYFVGPQNETICRLKILLNQRTRWCNYIEEVKNITNVKPNNNSESSASLNQSRFPFQICDISLPRDQTGSVFFMSQEDNSYAHIGSTLCLRTNLRNYNVGGYTSGTDIALYFRLFLLISYLIYKLSFIIININFVLQCLTY